MVIFKVTDGSQTRKFEVPSRITYSALKKKLSSVFPDSVNKDSDLVLHYRDSEGDVITLSSDLELQELLGTTQQTVLSFQLPRKKSTMGDNTPHRHCNGRFPTLTLADAFERELEDWASLLNGFGRSSKTCSCTAHSDRDTSSTEQGSASPDATTTESASEEARNKDISTEQTSEAASEGKDKETKSASKPAPENNDCNFDGYTVIRSFSPLLFSDLDLLFRPYPTRRFVSPIRWSPYGYGIICH